MELQQAVKLWNSKQEQCELYRDYYNGEHRLEYASRGWREKYASLVEELRENLCPAVVTSFTDAIHIDDWGDPDSDTEGLTRLEQSVNREAFTTGEAFVLAWPNRDRVIKPIFHPAHSGVAVADPENPDRLVQWFKIWRDTDTGRGRVNVYFADRVERFETVKKTAAGVLPADSAEWCSFSDGDGEAVIPYSRVGLPAGAVPVCWFKLDAPSQEEPGRSILADVIPLQDALNRSVMNLVITSATYADPFWYLLRYKPAPSYTNPFTNSGDGAGFGSMPGGNSDGLKFDRARQTIFATDAEGPFGQLDPPNLQRLLDEQKALEMKIARVVGMPAYLLENQISSLPSGSALREANRRRSDRIRAWQADASPVWRGLKQLLGMSDAPLRWRDPVPADSSEMFAQAQTLKNLGVALPDILQHLGFSDVEGMVARAGEDALLSGEAMGRAFLAGAAGLDS